LISRCSRPNASSGHSQPLSEFYRHIARDSAESTPRLSSSRFHEAPPVKFTTPKALENFFKGLDDWFSAQGLIRRGRRGHPAEPHGSPGDAKHRPQTALARLLAYAERHHSRHAQEL
jgi:hypothetical protein